SGAAWRELAQAHAEARRMIGRGGHVLRVRRSAQVVQPRVELATSGRREGLGEAVADPLERRDVARHASEIARCCVDSQLLRPELEARRVDLGLRAIAES